jgi:hypothetical protein
MANGTSGNTTNPNEPKPVFDFNKTELAWGESFDYMTGRWDMIYPKPTTDLRAAADAVFGYLAKITVSIPREWLIKDAPPNPDWSDPKSFRLIRRKDMQKLFQAAEDAAMTENVSGG